MTSRALITQSAADLLLTGRHITAAEAREFGLIGHVVPGEPERVDR